MVKKGSSLILVLIALVVLSIFGAAVISLTTSGFKVTKATNEDIRMKYFAEGGLDLALGVIIETISSDNDTIVEAINDEENYEGLLTSSDGKGLKLYINASLTTDDKILVLSNCSYEDVDKYGNKDVVAIGVYSIDVDKNVTLESISFE